jgi:two-component system CheB/CheR fusion protein
VQRGEPRRGALFPIVGVGASAGGLEAFTNLLAALPPDTGMGFVLVQHLDPDHESALTQILSRATSLPVHEITNDEVVQANHVYVIPPDTNLSIAGGVLKIRARERSRVPHRSIDAFFESLAQDQRERSVGVVLSGTANDGTIGLEAIKAEGGITFAQDDSAKHDSMPRSAIAAGCVDLVLSPADIARELTRIARHPYVAGQPLLIGPEDGGTLGTGQDDSAASGASNGYRRILSLLRTHSGVDFSLYKPTTMERRIARRLLLSKQATLGGYASFLRGNAEEIDALYSDVLISVTSFFRNPETFDFLERKILPELLRQRGDDPLRFWVVGCSTGQEAYSIAMTFVEAAEKAPRMRKLQVFATDVNDALLEKARRGLYAKSLVADITPLRLRRFFVETEGGYRVSKTLRDMVIFARQNLIADPPFSRMDLVSCRNLFIYLEASGQKKAMPSFHYALKPGGYLLLGASESVGGFTHLFDPMDRKHKIYAKKPASILALHLPVKEDRDEVAVPRPRAAMQRPGGQQPPEGPRGELNAQREADRITVSQFAPPGVLVNAELQVLQFRGATGPFLEPPTGKPSFDVLKMARGGLMLPLRSAINQARKQNKTARKENVGVKRSGKTSRVNLEVIPLKNLRERCFLILFEEAQRTSSGRDPPDSEPARADRARGGEKSNRTAELETELSETREYLQSMQEQLETANEEFQAANEEVQSANEELQSSNEELETSKEELESTNEELTTVNEEMSNRNVELNRLNDDLGNLQTAGKVAIVLLGRDLSIRRFDPQAEKQFDLLAADLGRPIGHIRHELVLGDATQPPLDLEGLSAEVVSIGREQEREVRDKGGHWYSLRVRPYLTLDNKVNGAVIVLVDIDTLKRSEQALRESHAQLRSHAEELARFNHVAVGRELRMIELKKEIDEVCRRHGETPRYPLEFEREIETRVGRSEEPPSLEQTQESRLGALNLMEDADQARRAMEKLNVELRQSAAELSEADRRKDEFVAMLGHELRNPLSALSHALDLLGRVSGDRGRSEELRGMMVRQTQRIGTLLEQLLDIARVASGKVVLSKECIDLADVVRTAVETVGHLVEARKQELTLSLPPDGSALVLGDVMRLAQAVENLLTNASKYTNEGGRIAVTLESDDDKAQIIIRDTGTGMSAELLPHVFEVFVQAPRTLERAMGGLGLGLPLVKRVVEMHEGHVDASSPGVGQGSEFVVTLPRLLEGRPKQRTEGEPAPAKPEIRPRRILVVDDEAQMAVIFASLLEANGHQTLVVHDGPSALAAVRSFGPDVVILDLGLPEMDGYEIARRIREEHADEKILLIAATGYQKKDARLKQAGFDQHLIKPFDMQRLAALIAGLDGGAVGPP